MKSGICSGPLNRVTGWLTWAPHKGAYSYWMSKAVGPQGEVLAFEPQPQLAARLTRLGIRNITVENMALSSAEGEMTLHVPGAGPSPGATLETRQGGSYRDVQVTVTTLDRYFPEGSPTISLIKIDVEGHELPLLEGGRTLLERDRPTLLLECEQRHHRTDSMLGVFSFLTGLNYEGAFFLRGRQVPVAEFDPRRHQSSEGPYINNFVFVPMPAESA